MRFERQGSGQFSSICILSEITNKRGNVHIFRSLRDCLGTLRLPKRKTIIQ